MLMNNLPPSHLNFNQWGGALEVFMGYADSRIRQDADANTDSLLLLAMNKV